MTLPDYHALPLALDSLRAREDLGGGELVLRTADGTEIWGASACAGPLPGSAAAVPRRRGGLGHVLRDARERAPYPKYGAQ